MNQSLPSRQSAEFLFLTVGLITCLTMLVNVSFKIVILHGMIFSVTSLICPVIAGLYLVALRKLTIKEQQHLLNISLMTLYTFCIGIYVLVNLPAAESMHHNPVYQIIFDDIPKKFFAATIAFAFSFYFPHYIFYHKVPNILTSPRQCMLLAILGGLSFFLLNFFLLFSESYIRNFQQIMLDSTIIASVLLLMTGFLFLLILLRAPLAPPVPQRNEGIFPLWYYLICLAIVIMLICLACEFKIVSFISENRVLAASALFFPISLTINTLIGELWGYRVNLTLSMTVIATQFIFDAVLMILVALPSPEFFNLNPFYSCIMIRRLPATFLTLSATYLTNTLLLHYLQQRNVQRPLRILIANICANSLLCLIDYSLLFGGIYPYDQIMNLVINVWQYKLFITLITLPVTIKICSALERKPGLGFAV